MKFQNKAIFHVALTALAVGIVGFFCFTLLLQPFFTGQWVMPQNLSLGGVKLQYYGIILALATMTGYWLTMRRKGDYKILDEDAETIFFIVLLCGFLGARLYHVFSSFNFYLESPAQIFAVWNGGLSIYGAGLGGVFGLLIYCIRNKKYSLMQLLDWLTPGVVLGQLIGRFGNFVNYELYGNPTNLPWKMFVPVNFRLPPFELNQFFHPLFLYEAAGSAIILVLLLRLKFKPGQLFLLWVLLYNVMRFFLEFLRVDSVVYGNLRVNALVSLILVGLAAFFLTRAAKQFR